MVGINAVKKSATVMLGKMFKNMEGKIGEEKLTEYVKGLIDIAAKETERSLIEEYSVCLDLLIFSSDDPLYIDGIINSISHLLMTALKESVNKPFFGSILMCLNKVLISLSFHNKLSEVAAWLLSFIFGSINNVIEQLGVLAKETTVEKLIITQILNLTFIITEWTNITLAVIDKSTKSNRELIKNLVTLPDVTKVLFQAVELKFCVEGNNPESLITSTGLKEIDISVNTMKSQSLKLINTFFLSLVKLDISKQFTQIPLCPYSTQLAPKVIDTLIITCNNGQSKIEELLNNEIISTMIVRLLTFLINTIEEDIFYSMTSKYKHNLLFDVAFNLMRASYAEVKAIEDNPENFVNLALDTCGDQESEIPKTEAAKLIETLCENIDGCISFIMLFASESIKYACTGGDPLTLVNYTMLSGFNITNNFLISSTPEEIIETALMIISDINYFVIRRKNIFKMLENLLIGCYVQLFESPSVLIKSRLALMLGYYASDLFKEEDESFEKLFAFLFNGLLAEKTMKAFALQCGESIKMLLTDVNPRIQAVVSKVLPSLCAVINEIELISFYEILITIIGYSSRLITIDPSVLIKSLVQRIEIEYKILKDVKNNMTITQCLNVIRAICEQEVLFPKYLDSIEAAVYPLFGYLKDPREIDFDSDVLAILESIIKHRKDISEDMFKALPYLINPFNKYEGTLSTLLPLLNLYIHYGKKLIAFDSKIIFFITEMINKSLFSEKEIIPVNNTEGALLAQILLQSIEGKALEPYIPIIIESTINRLQKQPLTNYLVNELYNTILCAVSNNPQATLQKIEAVGLTEKLFSYLFEISKDYKNTYDIKVLVIGLSSLLVQAVLPVYLANSQLRMMQIVISALESQLKKNYKPIEGIKKRAHNEDEEEYSSDDDMIEEKL